MKTLLLVPLILVPFLSQAAEQQYECQRADKTSCFGALYIEDSRGLLKTWGDAARCSLTTGFKITSPEENPRYELEDLADFPNEKYFLKVDSQIAAGVPEKGKISLQFEVDNVLTKSEDYVCSPLK